MRSSCPKVWVFCPLCSFCHFLRFSWFLVAREICYAICSGSLSSYVSPSGGRASLPFLRVGRLIGFCSTHGLLLSTFQW